MKECKSTTTTNIRELVDEGYLDRGRVVTYENILEAALKMAHDNGVKNDDLYNEVYDICEDECLMAALNELHRDKEIWTDLVFSL